MKKGKVRVFLWETIYKRLLKVSGATSYDIDIRYLGRWIKDYPEVFPKFMVKNNYTAYFNGATYRWEIVKGFKKIEFNPKDYVRC